MTADATTFDRDDKFVKSLARVAASYPAKALSAALAVAALLLTTGWTAAKLMAPPAELRERVAIEQAYRQNELPLSGQTDVTFLIDDFSAKVKARNQKLQADLQQSMSERDNASLVRGDYPWIALYWTRATGAVPRCKQHGLEFLRSEGMTTQSRKDPAQDTAIAGAKSGDAVYLLCSDQLSAIFLAVAGYDQAATERLTNRILNRLQPPAP